MIIKACYKGKKKQTNQKQNFSKQFQFFYILI